MLYNRRIYHFHPAKVDIGIALLPDVRKKTREVTGRDFHVLKCLYGPISTVVFDMRFQSEEDNHTFSSSWYPMLYQENFIALWFANMKQMTSEMWGLITPDHPDLATEEFQKVDDYWRKITYRLSLQPYSSCYDAAIEASKQIQVKTQENFQKNLTLSQCYMGVSNKIAMEFDFDDLDQQNRFTREWMEWLKTENLFGALFENLQEGTNEIWEAI
jgi:hypothetical protein